MAVSAGVDHLAMKRPETPKRLLLIEARGAGPGGQTLLPLKRYRIARLRFEPAAQNSAARFDYLKRPHD